MEHDLPTDTSSLSTLQDTTGAVAPASFLDATLAPGIAPLALTTPATAAYNPEQSRDRSRAIITYWLLGLLTTLFTGGFIAFFCIQETATFANLKALLDMLITPLIVLVSAATGFYFGANSANKSESS